MPENNNDFDQNILEDLNVLTGIDSNGWHFSRKDASTAGETTNLDLWHTCKALCNDSLTHKDLALIDVSSEILIQEITDHLDSAEWVAQLHGNSSLVTGCYPLGIKAGCRKHISCEYRETGECPFFEDNGERWERLKDKPQDTMPVLRECVYLGCVTAKRATKWVDNNLKEIDKPEGNWEKLKTIVAICGSDEATNLNSLCPHNYRFWHNTLSEKKTSTRINPFKYRQCIMAHPHKLPFDPKKPYNQLSDPKLQDNLYRQSGVSGIGLLVVDSNNDQHQGVYYLQMSSSENNLRDYYEFPYFYMGEQKIGAKKQAKEACLVQALFRGLHNARSQAANTKAEENSLVKLFAAGEIRASHLSKLDQYYNFLYCPDGEVGFLTLLWRLLYRFCAVSKEEQPDIIKKTLCQAIEIAEKELSDGESNADFKKIFADMLAVDFEDGVTDKTKKYATFDKEGLVEELKDLGLLNDDSPRLTSIINWLDAVKGKESFIPEKYFKSTKDRHKQYFCTDTNGCKFNEYCNESIVCQVATHHKNHKKYEYQRNFDNTYLDQLSKYVNNDLNNEMLQSLLWAILVTFDFFLKKEKTFFQLQEKILRHKRILILPYYAWRKLGDKQFKLGHLAVPLTTGANFQSSEQKNYSGFFLAGIDEDYLMRSDAEDISLVYKKIKNRRSLIYAISQPLTDTVLSYTLFQNAIKYEKTRESQAVSYRAHQMNNYLQQAKADLDANEIGDLKYLLFGIQNENYIYSFLNSNEINIDIFKQFYKKVSNTNEVYDLVVDSINGYISNFKKNSELTICGENKSQNMLVDFYFPIYFVNSILIEVLKNYCKYSLFIRDKDDVRKKRKIIIYSLSYADNALVLEFNGVYDEKEVKDKKQGFNQGLNAINSILKFIHNEGNFSYTDNFKKQGNYYTSLIELNIPKINDFYNKKVGK